MPFQRRECHTFEQVLLANRTQHLRDGDGEDVLHLLAVYLHTETGEGIRIHRRGRFKFDFQDDRAFRQSYKDVGTLAVVQRLSFGF